MTDKIRLNPHAIIISQPKLNKIEYKVPKITIINTIIISGTNGSPGTDFGYPAGSYSHS